MYNDDNELNNYINSKKNLNNLQILENKVKYYKKNLLPIPIKLSLHPCSGKSFFVKNNNNLYNNIFLYDFDYFLFTDPRRSRNIFNRIKINKHTCLIGCYENPNPNDNILDLTVVILHSKLLKYHKSRCDSTINGWVNLDKIMKSRINLIKNSINNNIPIFSSIYDALNFITNIWISN